MYDVIVVGAGPGGGSAAYFLTQAGLKVLVLEKETLPRYKSCGGGISVRFLEKTFPFSFESVRETDITAITYLYGRHAVTLPFKSGQIITVMRAKFDAFLLAHSGAEVIQNATVKNVIEHSGLVTVETRQGQVLNTRYVIGADGANSVVARSMGLQQNNKTAAAIEVELPVTAEMLQDYKNRMVYIFRQIRGGYIWIFPKADHLSIGIATIHPKPGELQATLKRVMDTYHIPIENGTFHGHPLPVFTRPGKVSTKRVLLVGDAAGLTDPLSGEGIRFAIKSGQLAAQAIISGHPERYSQKIFWKIQFPHIFTSLEDWIFTHTERYCLRLGAPNPSVTRTIVRMLNDEAKGVDIILVALVTLPFFALSRLWIHWFGKRKA